ncbi:MAG: GspE/PulE family protein [Phycisphaerales bacterium]|nr:GspE/PulE family protein [Phycisphaerales bacterium]
MGMDTLLLDSGAVTEAQVEEARTQSQRTGERIDRALVRMGHVSARAVLEALAGQLAMDIIDLADHHPAESVTEMIPSRLVFRLQCVPIEDDGVRLRVATSDPLQLAELDELRLLTGREIELVLADDEDLRGLIRRHYGVAGDTLDALGVDRHDSPETLVAPEDEAHEASVIKLVRDLLIEAVRERATDVHIEPFEHSLSIRYRIDGVLSPAGVPPSINQFRDAITSRLKIMAGLNVAERRRSQDGRIALRHEGREFDLRVSIIPMVHGEGIVLRILESSAVLLGLEQLGMEPELLQRWDDLIARPHGILLVTGPTGSGKSTTLYASLNRIVSDSVKAITIEDPVEYQLTGVNQIPVTEGAIDFAQGLRAVLRHDPDIVMVGEIRDRLTAEAAIQASLTGHLVFSTLHTNDAPSAMPRLIDMGVEPFLVSSSLEGVLAQRLVRRLCTSCDTPGSGCRDCRSTGYRGRVGLYELMAFDAAIRDQVLQRSASGVLRAQADERGLLLGLEASGAAKIEQGLTTQQEVARVTRSH